ncbi:MAG TPA: methyltransferase domain-containing protein [Cyclobacteriaceae bacterium]|nr:methyltransferase domain-containing protein [Cyclobacteriaceae bacterium]
MKLLLPVLLLATACASSKMSPDPCGPTMDQKSVREVFGPIISYMEIRDGDSFADVGASGGGLTIMMSSLMTNNVIYVQDIDSACLNEAKVWNLVEYYSKQCHRDLANANKYKTVIGTVHKTNLPIAGIDKIYSNATFHQFSDVDGMLTDIYNTLKPDGSVFFRDSFSDKEEVEYCTDKAKCGLPLTKTADFLRAMERNGFVLVKSQEFFGYPIYKFTKALH